MAANNLEAYIVSSNDQHLSEYIAECWKFREWLSGFTGSAGTLVVLEEEAGLWTDSRYFLQAEKELDGSHITLFRSEEPGVPTPMEWLSNMLDSGLTVGLDGRTFCIDDVRLYAKELRKNNIRLDANQFLIDEIWTTRPLMPESSIYDYPVEFAGTPRSKKIQQIRRLMQKNNVTHFITSSLDEIAWILNLRGNDIPYNPVFHAFLIIGEETTHLFTNPHKLTSALGKILAKDDIKISLYDDFYSTLKDLNARDHHIYIDPKRTNASTFAAIPQNVQKSEGLSLIALPKACKTQQELTALDEAMLKDGVAMVQWWHWLEENIGKTVLTEIDVASKAKEFRALLANFKSESFKTIAGYASNGAIVHYSAKNNDCATLQPKSFLLFDSGAQYLQGTTDLTRTIALGELSQQEKIDYTLVLKGHIALAQACFPEGTKGYQLDILARLPLWQNAMNYGHGTGHGVGSFLNVHEGPHGISPKENSIALQKGMITSNEPGLYKADQYGIRIENLMTIEENTKSEFGTFLKFRTLTLCPIDTKPIDIKLLTQGEIDWLNEYHQTVLEKLSPYLTESLQSWLIQKTKLL